MPAAIASPGSAGAYGCPFQVIEPVSGAKVPAMMFDSVDLPAPFSPSSATTSPGLTSRSIESSACVAPKRLETPCTDEAHGWLAMYSAALALVVRNAGSELLLRDLARPRPALRALDGHPAHLLRLLGHRGVDRAVADGLQAGDVAVEADDRDLVADVGHAHGLGRAERHRVRPAEEDRDVRVGLEHVLGDVEALVLIPVGGLLGHDLQAGALRQRLLEALVAVDLGRRADLALQDRRPSPRRSVSFGHVLAELLGRGDGVGGDERVRRARPAGCGRRR